MRAEARPADPTQRLSMLVAAAACLIGTVLLAVASPAFAVEDKFNVTHAYNATHSLTGDCSVSASDPVEDPACPEGPLPPEGPLVSPTGVAVDTYGDQYVVNNNPSGGANTSNIDIFDPEGHYIGGFNVNSNFPSGFSEVRATKTVAVDSSGHLYVAAEASKDGSSIVAVVRYDPTTYNPEAGEIAYGSPAVPVAPQGSDPYTGSEGIAVNTANDHFYINRRSFVVEYGPATDGVPNEVLTEDIGEGVMRYGNGAPGDLAIDAQHGRLYVLDEPLPSEPANMTIDAFELAPPYQLLGKVDGSTTPAGIFDHSLGEPEMSLTVDEGSGHFFFSYKKKVYELKADGAYIATIPGSKDPKFGGVGPNGSAPVQLAYDNSELSPNRGYLYAPSGGAVGHLYAYELTVPLPPTVKSLSTSGISEDEAVLHAKVNPAGDATHYIFDYTTQADFEANGFANAQLAGEGDLASGGEGVAVAAAASGLSPGTSYRFRVRAENHCEPAGCAAEAQSSFTTFAPYAQGGSCANQALRIGASAGLPDCRAYELATPPDTGGRAPFTQPEASFAFWTGSPDGSSLAFNGDGGAFPGQDTPGGYNGDAYVSRRGASGWSTEAVGLLGSQSASQLPGGLSPDHSFSAVTTFAAGNVEAELGSPADNGNSYIRYPDGSLRLLGEGSIGQDKLARPVYISSGGGHIVFTAKEAQLEPNAPPAGTTAIYDRTLDGTVHVVSLLPEDLTPSADAEYEGVSANGSSVAFKLGGGPMYLRLDNALTLEAAPAGATFAGLSEEGRYLFYLLGGNLYRYDAFAESAVAMGEGGGITPAYVSADGSTAYFTSKAILTPEEGPNGATATAGQNNLYLAREGEVRFVATVTERDVKGVLLPTLPEPVNGFADWLKGPRHSGTLPLRATPDGEALLFTSRADLGEFKSGGKAQIYRYDAAEVTIACLSCNPTGEVPASDASLLSPMELESVVGTVPISSYSIVPNLSRDGRRAFFESDERLVTADEDGARDVYEWEAEGTGGCAEPGGCVFLISSGQSSRNDYLYGASESGDDVFIYTADLLNGEDVEEAPSVYDARVEGGFPLRQAAVGECQGEACQPAAVAPNDPTPASSAFEGSGNVKPEGEAKTRCPKGKKAARRGGKSRCVPRHHHKKQHKRANANRRAGR